jgi:hypothetical protein
MTSASAKRTNLILPIIALVLLLICLLVPNRVSAGPDVASPNSVFVQAAGPVAP